MNAGSEQRQLAAIVFTDMVGYSALAQRDEALALELLEEHRRILREIVARFHGTEIKTIGDAFLLQFRSALEAVQCAIEVQRTFAKRNHDVSGEHRIELRIGIHLGDVVHRDGDVYGDGVNIASRIEPLADPGGICISEDVERQVRSAVGVRVEKLAPTELKNIQLPMALFRLVLGWERRPAVTASPSSRKRAPIINIAIAALILFALLAAAGLWLVSRDRAKPSGRAATADKSIAVLPFVDMSQDKDQEYFSDGIAEELLNRLAQLPDLKVAARTSAFQFRGKNLDMADIGRQLKVGHVLEGSVRKSGGNLRISAQLIQCNSGYHIWSQAYDRKLDDVFAIQEEIARAIAEALSVQLKLGGEGKPERPTQDMAAYGDYLEARALIAQRNADNLRRATTLLEAAVQRDPGFAKAWAALAQARALGFYYLVVSMKQSLEGAESAARKALMIDDSLGAAHSALADVLRDRLDWLPAEAEYRRALELSPGEAETHNQYAQMLLRVGHFDAALEHANRACELDPLAWVPPSIVALIQLSRGDLAQSRVWLDRFEKARGKIDGLAIRLELIHALSRHDRGLARRTLAMAGSSTAAELSSPADKKLIEAMDQALASTGNGSQPAPNLSRALTDSYVVGEPHVDPEFAIVAAFLNQLEVALDALWYDMRSAGVDLAWIWRTPPFRPLCNEPRFLELLRTMKLPEYWRVAGWPEFYQPEDANDFECVPP